MSHLEHPASSSDTAPVNEPTAVVDFDCGSLVHLSRFRNCICLIDGALSRTKVLFVLLLRCYGDTEAKDLMGLLLLLFLGKMNRRLGRRWRLRAVLRERRERLVDEMSPVGKNPAELQA